LPEGGFVEKFIDFDRKEITPTVAGRIHSFITLGWRSLFCLFFFAQSYLIDYDDDERERRQQQQGREAKMRNIARFSRPDKTSKIVETFVDGFTIYAVISATISSSRFYESLHRLVMRIN